MAHFMACTKTNDVVQAVELYFREKMRLHRVSRPIIFDRDAKFLSHLWLTFWKKLGIKLKFSTICHPQIDSHTLGVLLGAVIKAQAKAYDLLLPHVEFAYN